MVDPNGTAEPAPGANRDQLKEAPLASRPPAQPTSKESLRERVADTPFVGLNDPDRKDANDIVQQVSSARNRVVSMLGESQGKILEHAQNLEKTTRTSARRLVESVIGGRKGPAPDLRTGIAPEPAATATTPLKPPTLSDAGPASPSEPWATRVQRPAESPVGTDLFDQLIATSQPESGPLQAKVHAELRELRADQQALFNFAYVMLPERIRELERAKSSTDGIADLVIYAMQVMVEPIRYHLGPLLPRIRGYLERDYHDRASEDRAVSYLNPWLSTIGSLANITPRTGLPSQDGDPLPGFWLEAVYSNFLPASITLRRAGLAEDEHRILAFVLNNVVVSGEQIIEQYRATLADSLDNAQVAETVLARARDQHRRLLAAGAGFEDIVEARPQDDGMAHAILEALEVPLADMAEGRAAGYLAAFEQMDKVGTTVPLETFEPARTLFRLVAGNARATERNARQTAAPFFNVGVALSHIQNTSRLRRDEALQVRTLCNAIGLRWAVELNRDLLGALITGDGLDCAVNLFGTLAANEASLNPSLRAAAEQIFQALRLQGEQFPAALDRTDIDKIVTSARVLGLKETGDREDPDARFKNGLQSLLEELTSNATGGRQTWPRDSKEIMLATARVSQAALARWLGAEQYRDAIGRAAEVALGFLRDKADPERTTREVYGPLVDGTQTGRLGEPLFGHPTVKALGHPEIDRLWHRAQRESIADCPDLAVAVQEAIDQVLEQARRR